MEKQNNTKPDDLMAQIANLLQSAGYAGLSAVAIAPKTGEQINPINFIPDGWRLEIALVKKDNGNQFNGSSNIQQK